MLLLAKGQGGSAQIEDLRVNIRLLGTINDFNKVFTLPGGEAAVDLSSSGSATIDTYYNGKRLEHGSSNDFVISESGGPGTGFNTIALTAARLPPKVGDKLTANWIKAP